MSDFFDDVWRGLNATPKYLDSKYFYDEAGDAIFREIMNCPEYYLTNCEMEIFSGQSGDIADEVVSRMEGFDVVELGPGDASKSRYLLEALLQRDIAFTYFPIDISGNVISQLIRQLPRVLPGLTIRGLNGDYFAMLHQLKQLSMRPKLVLFLGSSIGNIVLDKNAGFFQLLRSYLQPGDMLLTGFDLMKDPEVILAAYNDSEGITKRFNLNLLHRINVELGADFDLSTFVHRPQYDEMTGACKSYLESTVDQQVHIGDAGVVSFRKGEQIAMEVSQKYTVPQTAAIAADSGFQPVEEYFDSRRWFLDALWIAR